MSEHQLTHFSLISRLFGNLFYRSPDDAILQGVFDWLSQQGLSQVWALETDNVAQQALANLQLPIDRQLLAQEYRSLFLTDPLLINPKISAYGINVAEFIAFRQQRGMPDVENADHFGLLFLTASWIEDNLQSTQAQRDLFGQFLLPCASKFLTRVEQSAKLPFYRSLALLSREILAAMADELDESDLDEDELN